MSDAASASRVEIAALPAAGLSAATGGALALGSLGLVTGTTGTAWPCLFAVATTLPCPFCGLTHGVAALGAGDLGAAVAAHPLAPLAVALALAAPVALLVHRRLAVAPSALWALGLLVGAVWLARVLL